MQKLGDVKGTNFQVFDLFAIAIVVATFIFQACLAAPELAYAEDAAYGMLYSNGDLVFQRGNTPDAQHSGYEILGQYTGFETAEYDVELVGYTSGGLNLFASTAPWSVKREAITSVSFNGSIHPRSTKYWFSGLTSLKAADLSGLDATSTTSMASMFNGCESLVKVDLSAVDTSRVSDMSSLFAKCSSLQSIDLSRFSTNSATNISDMFSSCSSLRRLDLSAFDTSKVRQMSGMFNYCRSLESLDISSFVIGDDIEKRDGSIFGNSSMFTSCNKLNTIKLGRGFKFCTYMGSTGMLGNLPDPPSNSPYFGYWRDEDYVLYSARQLVESHNANPRVKVYKWAHEDEVDLAHIPFAQLYENGDFVVQKGKAHDGSKGAVVEEWGGLLDTSYDPMLQSYPPWYGLSLKVRRVEVKESFAPSSIAYWFNGMKNLEYADLRKLDASRLIDASYAFQGCSSLASLDLSTWQAPHLTNAGFAFENCTALKTLDLSQLDGSDIVNIGSMLSGCTSLETLDIRSFNTSSLNTSTAYGAKMGMDSTFAGCGKLSAMVLGPDFAFQSSCGLSGNQVWNGPNGKKLTLGELVSSYDGSSMSGTWLRDGALHTHIAISGIEKNRVEPSCTNDGGVDVVSQCKVCGESLASSHAVFPALGHSYLAEIVAPTYGVQGFTRHVCSRCGDVLVDTYTAALSAESKALLAINPLKVKGLAKTVKVAMLAKKAQKVKALKVTNAKGKVTYKNASKSKKLKKFKVNAKSGKITVPKGTKKGTYKVKVKVKAAGDATHKAATKTVTCKIKVK